MWEDKIVIVGKLDSQCEIGGKSKEYREIKMKQAVSWEVWILLAVSRKEGK